MNTSTSPLRSSFRRVEDIAHQLAEPHQREGSTSAPSIADAIEVATCYLIACERHNRHHHFDDSPDSVWFVDDPDTGVQQAAWEAVWDIITANDDHLANARMQAAWTVWGCSNCSRMSDSDDNTADLEPIQAVFDGGLGVLVPGYAIGSKVEVLTRGGQWEPGTVIGRNITEGEDGITACHEVRLDNKTTWDESRMPRDGMIRHRVNALSVI